MVPYFIFFSGKNLPLLLMMDEVVKMKVKVSKGMKDCG